MLTADDIPTIRHAIDRRLEAERGIAVLDVHCRAHDDYIHVYVELMVSDALQLNSEFQLPSEFEHSHLLNEIDEIAEAAKRARMEYWLSGRQVNGNRFVPGSGLRGRWAQYG